MKSIAAALLSTVLLSGCFSFNKIIPETGASVTGLKPLLERGNPVSMLFVHGMGIHDPGYSEKLQMGFAESLGLTLDVNPTDFEIERNDVTVAHMRIRVARDSSSAPRLRFVELTWSILTTSIKLQLLELDPVTHKEDEDIETDRLWANSFAKEFVNARFSDAVLYSGALKEELNSIVAEAICTLSNVTAWEDGECSGADSREDEAHDIVLVTQSLGSAMVFDTLAKLGSIETMPGAAENSYGDAARHTIENTRYIYMLANQLPLIDLSSIAGPITATWLNDFPCKGAPTASRSSRDKTEGSQTGMGGFLKLQATSHRVGNEKLEITALSDPNDVLSYWLTTRFKQHCETGSVRINNIKVRNARVNWFFVYADLVKAHTGFEGNRKVIDFLVNGTP